MSSGKTTASGEACTQCRGLKIKCRPLEGSEVCQRCFRKSLQCIYQQKKRGRKPFVRNARVESTGEATAPVAAHLQHDSVQSPWSARPGDQNPLTIDDTSVHTSGVESAEADGRIRLDALQPSNLLSEGARTAKFSLSNILKTRVENDTASEEASLTTEDDPIEHGILSYHVGVSLFEGFMSNFNPLVCILDAKLHTFHYVRSRSAFLLTVVLAAAARAFNPALHVELQEHADMLCGKNFVHGAKTTETIQAFLLSTYWKRPEDTRSWAMVGYSIRLAMELGWHKFSMQHSFTTDGNDDVQWRTRRSAERTWLVLFVYDRSMSLQTGKPWMIECSDFIKASETWYLSPSATPNDTTLAAFIALRMITADVLDAFIPQRLDCYERSEQQSQFTETMTSKIKTWVHEWCKTSTSNHCHRFLVCFFGAHALLVLNAFQLQLSISRQSRPGDVASMPLQTVFESAVEMLDLVSDRSGSTLLTFAHDSIHTMIAYAASLLIKVLLSLDAATRDEIDRPLAQAIDRASRAFAGQGTPPTFACAMLAKFLENMLGEYRKLCSARTPNVRPSEAIEMHSQPRGFVVEESNHHPAAAECVSIPAVPSMTEPPQPSMADGQWGNGTFPQPWAFADEVNWSSMFSDAGFALDGGVFMPS